MNRYTPKSGLGASSVMLILVTLSLTVFSVLALASARSDHRFTQTALESTAAYYAADGQAQQTLAQVDALLAAGASPRKAAGVSAQGEGYRFSVPVDENRQLVVEFRVENGSCRITGYRVENHSQWDPQAGLTLG